MDELDLLLDGLESTEAKVVSSGGDTGEIAELALQEFTSAETPADRLEALKLLIRLSGK